MKREAIGDDALSGLVRRMELGDIAADLGGGVFKERLARSGAGKSGGYRVILVFRRRSRAVFVFGYAKSALANISGKDLEAFRALAKVLFDASDDQIAASLQNRTLFKIDAET